MAADPYRYFRVEAAELHTELGQGVLDLERAGRGAELVPRLLRLAHTLKGAARVVKQREIADHAHAIEDALEPFRDTTAPAPRDRIDALLKLLDGIGERVALLSASKEASAPAAGPPSAASSTSVVPSARAPVEEAFRTVRANVGEMDALLDGIGQTQIQIGALRRSQASLEHARRLVDILVDQLANPRAVPLEKTRSLAHELQSVFASAEQGLEAGVHQLDQELGQVRDAAEQMRLVPASALFTPLERAVRDVAQAQAKSVIFEGRGGDIRLDAHVLGIVQGALLQLVRNAVAHGLETEAERAVSRKPRTGQVVLDVSRRGRRVVFTCRDDGRGIDPGAVRRAAQRRAAGSAEARAIDSAPLLDLLMRGGVSTSAAVTELSGRGIGLDLLRAAAERLGAEVSLDTAAGKGTSFELVVPLSLASLEVLLVDVAERTIAIPLDAVRSTLRLARADIASTAQGASVVHDGHVIPFVPLAQLLVKGGASREAAHWSVVIVHAAKGLAALGVERLLGTSTVIQRPLPELAPASAVVAGASIDASGNPQLVLDADGLVAAAREAVIAPERVAAARRRILVVDDSLTTRMLEQSILESAGYDVDVAASAEEGLEKASQERFALTLVDVEMPGMDGFAFVQRTREDPSLRDMPCILVTSRGSVDDRQRGRDVGARGYIVKGEFDQNQLLERIKELVA